MFKSVTIPTRRVGRSLIVSNVASKSVMKELVEREVSLAGSILPARLPSDGAINRPLGKHKAWWRFN
jgi:hypothetical protein